MYLASLPGELSRLWLLDFSSLLLFFSVICFPPQQAASESDRRYNHTNTAATAQRTRAISVEFLHKFKFSRTNSFSSLYVIFSRVYWRIFRFFSLYISCIRDIYTQPSPLLMPVTLHFSHIHTLLAVFSLFRNGILWNIIGGKLPFAIYSSWNLIELFPISHTADALQFVINDSHTAAGDVLLTHSRASMIAILWYKL